MEQLRLWFSDFGMRIDLPFSQINDLHQTYNVQRPMGKTNKQDLKLRNVKADCGVLSCDSCTIMLGNW